MLRSPVGSHGPQFAILLYVCDRNEVNVGRDDILWRNAESDTASNLRSLPGKRAGISVLVTVSFLLDRRLLVFDSSAWFIPRGPRAHASGSRVA
jgi:hypothetical protein